MGEPLEGVDKTRNGKCRLWLSRSVTLCWALYILAAPAMARTVVISGPAYVIDGDTLVIRKQHIRLFGVDAFESDQTCGRFRCGIEARNSLRNLIRKAVISCEKQDIDAYGRTVAICKTSVGIDLGREMVREGLAVAYRRFSLRYLDDESYARTHRLGAWNHGFESPLQYRRQAR